MKKRVTARRLRRRWRWTRWRLAGGIWLNRLRHLFLAPFGRLRKPRPLIWNVDAYGEGLEPECPNCGEMPYSESVCYFCGQRFTNEAQDEIW